MRFWTALLLVSTALGHPQLHNYRRANSTLSASTSPQGTTTPSLVSNFNSSSNSKSSKSVVGVLPTPISSDAVATASASFSGDYEFPTSRFGAIPTLMPVIPDTVDVSKIENLTPVKSGPGEPLHYLQESQSGDAGVFAIATPNWKFPSVVLDHSAAISSVQFSTSGNLVIVFANKIAFDHSATNWNAKDGLIFITYTPGCGDFDKNERCYYEVNGVNFNGNSLSATANGTPRSIHDATNNISLQWGDYNNQSVNYAGGAPSPSGTSSGSGSSTDSNSPSTTLSTAPTSTPTCAAPVDSKYGLPTACLGYHFDDDLDSGLGYFNLSHFDFENLISDISLNYDQESDLDTSVLEKRIFKSLTEGAKNAAKNIAQGVNIGFKKTTQAAGALANTIKAVPKKVETKVKDFVSQAKKDLDRTYIEFKDKVKDIQGDVETLMEFLKGTPIEIPLNEEPRDITLPRPSTECEASGNTKRAPSSGAKATPRKTKASKAKKEKKEKKEACHPKEGAKGVESPWGGKAVLIKSWGTSPTEKELRPSGSRKQTLLTKGKFLNVYCVQCGITGSLTTKGSVIFDLTHGITGGKVEGDIPNLSIGVGIGIFAEWERSDVWKQNLYDIPVSPFTVGFATIGPIISIGTEFKIGAKMSGNVHARADVKFEKTKFSYDFATKKFEQSGFTPKSITPGFEAEGSLELTASFGIPVALELALTVGPCSACKGSIGIETVPTLEANATVAVQATYDAKTKKVDYGMKPVDGCSGISTAITARNYVNWVFHGFKILKDQGWPIHTSAPLKIKSWCIPVGKKSTKRQATISASANASMNVTATNGTDAFFDLTPYIVNTVDDLGFIERVNPEVPLNVGDDEDYWYSTIELQGSDGAYYFSSCNDGNVYMQTNETYYDLNYYETCTTLWAGSDETVLSAPSGAVLHYYNNTISKTGVSRLRVSQEDELPDTAVYVALTPFTYDISSPSMLAAIDPYNNLFFPVVCTYTNSTQGAKIYLVDSDVEAGIAMLKSPDVSYSITNGEVKDCQLLFLELTDRTEGAWADFDEDTDSIYENDPLELEFDETFLIDGDIDESKLGKIPDETEFEFEDLLGEDWVDDFYEDDEEEDA